MFNITFLLNASYKNIKEKNLENFSKDDKIKRKLMNISETITDLITISSDEETDSSTDNSTDSSTYNSTDSSTDNTTDSTTEDTKESTSFSNSTDPESLLREELLLGYDNFNHDPNNDITFFAYVRYYEIYYRTFIILIVTSTVNLRALQEKSEVNCSHSGESG